MNDMPHQPSELSCSGREAGSLGGGDAGAWKFLFGEQINLDETGFIEFKEIRGANPMGSIINTADEYAVPFLNSEGGRTYWGIRDDGTIVGVPLSPEERDRLRREVTTKLHAIQPHIDPTRFTLKIHTVICRQQAYDLGVVELEVPKSGMSEPCFTGGHEPKRWAHSDARSAYRMQGVNTVFAGIGKADAIGNFKFQNSFDRTFWPHRLATRRWS